ncbi:NAD(P)H-hydrate dehydratase [Sphingomonas bacterium]|uniref:NAD(P)H-hydrate dehydratase n=1 Tax=Sphingomonas bacterium TaxID=1895847 RepID=UPI001576494F|nr:NAD(P)H-hydrate dehydratase [Sphingomonas bacterium]
MIAVEGRPILTAAEMRAAEIAAMTADVTVDTLMARAGGAVATAVRRLAAGGPVLVLCGPGNNGGDGYIAAARLKAAGVPVRVAASAAPGSDAFRTAAAGWDGPVEALGDVAPAPVLVDALFGTGLSRPIDDAVATRLRDLAAAARLTIAVDLPSGVSTDDGAVLSLPPVFDVVLALGAVKPAHVLQPAARYARSVRLLDIGVAMDSDAAVLDRPSLPTPGPDAQKYTRGMVAVVAGSMAGAAELASVAAMRAGAGYVLLLGKTAGPPHALVRKPLDAKTIGDTRIGALLVGPGLGRDDEARAKLDLAFASGRLMVIDGDALHLVDPARIAARAPGAILTPHGGEFDALFGKSDADKIARTRDAARRSGAVVVFKGADTVIASPTGRVCVAGGTSDWLSTAGTGDVLAGTIAATRASGMTPFDAACAGVWLHGEAARRAGPAFIADDLADALTAARASL